LAGKIRIDYPDTANAPLIVADVMPVYPGKEKQLHKELLACVALDSNTHHCDDDVIFQLIVEKDGSVTHPLIILCQDPDVANALLMCVGKLGKWKPGEHRGKPVAVRKTIVLPFKKI
jgi:protein TonB